jgi:hypothetical protein
MLNAYFHSHFTDAEKLDKLVRVVAPVGSAGVSDVREGTGPAPVGVILPLLHADKFTRV